MYDFIKFYINQEDKSRFDKEVKKDDAVDLFSRIDYRTGQLGETERSDLGNIELTMTPNNSFLKGSIHKLYNIAHNQGVQNYSDFSLCQAKQALKLIISHYKVNPELTLITNLEFGINIPVEFDPALFIDESLILFYYKDHTINKKFKNRGDYKEFRRTDYSMKIYNKSKQYNRHQHLLRIEIKITNKRVLQKLGIFTVSDLYDEEASWRLFQFLLTQYRQLLIIDSPALGSALRSPNMDLLKNYSNPMYWIHLEKSLSSSARNKRRKRCFQYLNKNSLNTIKKEIEDLLWLKYEDLLECSPI
ncbi:hypothetical protein ACXYMT_02530 [Salinimicrobium sp. CAU 1759]